MKHSNRPPCCFRSRLANDPGSICHCSARSGGAESENQFPIHQEAPISVGPRPLRVGGDRALYTWAAVVALLVVFAGFSRTFFLKGAFGAPELTALLLVHGIVMTLWFSLFLVQARLVASGRTDLHRRLGILGGLLAVGVVIVGVTVGISAARQGHSPGPPPLVFLGVPLFDMLVFASLVSTALYFRSKPETHKRLMLLANLSILTAAIARIPVAFIHYVVQPMPGLLVAKQIGFDLSD